MIYTVGNRAHYLAAIAREGTVFKTGRHDNYPGGYAVQTIEDAERLIVEQGQVGVWGVFGLLADWETDTEPSKDGWWHDLLIDAPVVVLD